MSVMAKLRQTRKRKKSSDYLREHIARFNKSRPELVKIDPSLNQFIMTRSVHGGDSVKVEVSKSGDILNVKLAPGQMPEKPEEQSKKPGQLQQKPGAASPLKTDTKSYRTKEDNPKSESANKKAHTASQKPAKESSAQE